MTSFNQTFRATIHPKLRTVNAFLFFNLLAVILTMLYAIWENGFTNLEMIGPVVFWGGLFCLAAFVRVTLKSERVLVSDTYRLLPVSEWVLYLANLATSFVALVYMGLVQLVLLVIGSAMNGSAVRAWIRQYMNLNLTAADWHQFQVYGLSICGYAIAILLWSWVFITLIHFATDAISAFIPGSSQRIVKGILAVLLTWGVIAFLNWVGALAGKLIRLISNVGTFNMAFNFVTIIAAIVVVSLLNVYLMKHWVEARY